MLASRKVGFKWSNFSNFPSRFVSVRENMALVDNLRRCKQFRSCVDENIFFFSLLISKFHYSKNPSHHFKSYLLEEFYHE